AEFARLGQTRAEFDRAREQQVQHGRTAVRVQLQGVLAGERSGSPKEERKTGIDRLAVGTEEGTQGRDARGRHGAEQRLGDRCYFRTGDASDAATASTWRGRDRRDRAAGARVVQAASVERVADRAKQ